MIDLSRFKDKEFWKKEFKKIKLNDILIWIAIILVFLAAWQNINAGNDPCSYCMVNDPSNAEGQVSCKEYFSYDEGLTLEDLENNSNFTLKNEYPTGDSAR